MNHELNNVLGKDLGIIEDGMVRALKYQIRCVCGTMSAFLIHNQPGSAPPTMLFGVGVV